MDIGDIEKHAGRIRLICRKWGIPRLDAEECVQSIFIKRLEGKAKHQLIAHSVVDWMRSYYVSKRNKNYEDQLKFRFPVEYDGKRTGEVQADYISGDFIRIVSKITNLEDRDIVVRHLAYGETFTCIAEVYNVSHTTIANRYWKIVRALKGVISLK